MAPSLKEKITYFYQHSFVRNVATLQAGNFFGTAIQAVVGILLARFLQPEQFGVYALVFSLASLTSILLGTGIQDAITPAISRAWFQGDKEEVGHILAFWVKLILMTAILTLVVSTVLPWAGGRFYRNTDIGFYAMVIVAASVISTLIFSFTLLALQISGHIRGMMLLTLSDQSVRYGFSLALVIGGFGVLGAVAGHLFGAMIVVCVAGIIWMYLHRRYALIPSLSILVDSARRANLRRLLKPSLWVSLDRNIAMLYMSLPVALAGLFITTTEVTYFKLSFGYISLAMSLLGPISVLLNVEFPKIQVENSKKLISHFIRVSLYATGLSVLITTGAIIASPVMFKILYGEAFMPSVPYVFGLFLYGALFGIGVGLGPMWRAIDRVKTSILINLCTLGAGIPLGIILIREFHVWGAVAMVTLWYTVSHLASFIYLATKLRKL
ncbi:MAG: oligosaccharide flippase family protein [Patescibacteria group bacterium]